MLAAPDQGGLLLVLAVLVPFIGVLIGLAVRAEHARRIALLTLAPGLAIAVAIAAIYLRTGEELVYLLGGWSPPLGVALRADAAAVAMLLAVAVVVPGIGLYALADFDPSRDPARARMSATFWLLLLAIWGSLNLVFVSGDLFTLYVALELLTFAGVPLVCLDGRGDTLRAALRYLLFALLGSLLYLLGAVLLYGAYGTLDIALLRAAVRPEPVTWTVLALATAGLLAKTALFPLHIWLPPAHAGAPAAASAVLSALVIKGSWFLVIRLWFDALPGAVTLPAAQLLGALGAAAIVFGSIVALRQARLKLLVAYSTVAQIGYLFLMFPLGFDALGNTMAHGDALTGGVLQGISHATAKASMFMAAGLIYAALGHDRIADLAGVARAMPLTVLTFALAGIALMGIVPSGAYLAKKLLLGAAHDSGQWWWTLILQGGAAFTAAYVVLVLVNALRRPGTAPLQVNRVSVVSEYAALGLALASLLLALAALGPLPRHLVSNPLAAGEVGASLLVVAAGMVLALGLARQSLFAPALATGAAATGEQSGAVHPARDGLLRQVAAVGGAAFERFDLFVRGWAVACVGLLSLSLLFGALLSWGVAE
jgi:formate hydrogenlyase subunit 3/multisubunit Na+/H+ antiporter MnhD subunit